MKKQKLHLAGYSLPELLLVLSILGVLFSLTTINLFSSYHKNTLNTTISTLLADLKQQQLKTMVGDTEGQTTQNEYGVYFPPDGLSYILFLGATYSPPDPANFAIKLNNDLQFSSILVPDRQIVFAKGSGEVANYNPSFANFTLENVRTDETKTIIINQFGTIINIY